MLSDGKKSRSKKKEESADPIVTTPTKRGEKDEEMPSGSKTSPSKVRKTMCWLLGGLLSTVMSCHRVVL